MSPDRSLFASAVLFKTFSSPKELRPQAVCTHDSHVSDVFQNLMYGSMYGFQPAKTHGRPQLETLMGNSPEICRRHYAALVAEDMAEVVEFGRPPSIGPRMHIAPANSA